MNQLIEPRAYRLFDEKPNNDVEGSKVRLRKMIREKDALLDFREPLKALGFETELVPAMRILNDIYTHQQLFKEGGNELVEIGINGWSSTYRNKERRILRTRLKAAGCIECDEISLNGNYGSKAFYYKFDQGFYDGAVLRVANQKPYLKKLAKKARKLKEGDTLIEPSFKRQLEANLRELQVDMTELSRLYELYQNNASFVKKLLWSFKPFQDDYTQVYQQKNRIFTPVVNLPSGFRSLISHKKNKRLIKVDIVTCHATFLSSLYKGESKEERKEAKYFRNVLRNDFYERIRERVFEQIRPSNRSDVKEMFNSSLNNKEWGRDKIRISKFNKVGQAFLRMFPNLYKRIKEFVCTHRNEIISKKGYPSIGIALMAIELKVLYPVYNQLIARGYWFVPMHDGFVVEEDGSSIAIQLTEQSLEEKIGTGKVKLDNWIMDD